MGSGPGFGLPGHVPGRVVWGGQPRCQNDLALAFAWNEDPAKIDHNVNAS